MAQGLEYLIGYDISDNRNRRRALKILRAECMAYQDSVFEVKVNKRQLDILVDQLLANIDEDTDRLFYARLSQVTEPWQLGAGAMSPRGNLMIIS